MKKNKVFFDMVISLDGFIAPEKFEMALAGDPEFKNSMKKWMDLMHWVFQQKFFLKNLKFGEGGETGEDNTLLEETFTRTGASIMGKNMFNAGENSWPDDAPFHTPVFVLTDEVREPWVRPGGTTFYFVNDGIESALAQAKKVVGSKDIRISGGANTVMQYLNAGLIEEFTLHYAPVVFGNGVRLFENMNPDRAVKIKKVIPSQGITHIMYEVEQ
ncbi:MAG TPA: dihydrofolate reductase family protein [Candidatus Kapabacteria bacterium]|nr:dihydrofolate reductase family protein [Candidatus Kapabacteria bacterium]